MKKNKIDLVETDEREVTAEGQSSGGEAPQTRTRRRRRFHFREWLILTIPVIATVVAVLVVFFVREQEITYTLSDSGYQYYGGASAGVSAGTKLQLTKEGDVIFTDSGNKTTLPIYLENSRTAVLTANMVYYMPRTNQEARAVNFSEVECRENGMIYVTRDGQAVTPQAGFLYDGKDFYLFLEPMVVSYMGYSITLPALSYAEVRNGGDIMLFNYETKEFIIERLEGSATAAPPYGEYTISLLGDSMTDTKGTRILLVTKPKDLDPLE